MPSPFPGMDPFLEHPTHFPDVHDSLIIYLREHLQQRLPVQYYAVTGERLWVEVSERYIEPDIDVVRSNEGAGRPGESGGVAVATGIRTQPVVVTVPHDEHREVFLNIMTRQGASERVITTVEVLSLTNKTPGEQGRDLYERKQKEVLASKTHLVEIDLLRGGVHTTAVPLKRALRKTGPFDYHVCMHRFDNLEDYFVWPVQLTDGLPEIVIPLLPGDPDVPLDLQQVFDAGPYRRRVRYDLTRVDPALRPEHAEWAKTLLREKGLLISPSVKV